jgi:hypothetical protein
LAEASSAKVAVLDRADAGGKGALDGTGRVGVDGHVGVPVVGRPDRGPDFRLAVLGDVQLAIVRGDSAAPGQLELTGAAHQLLAGRAQHRVDPVGDRACSLDLALAQRCGRIARQLGEHSEVAVS